MSQNRKSQPFGMKITTDDARGGVTHQGVRYVLAFGIGGAVVALGLVAFFLTHFA